MAPHIDPHDAVVRSYVVDQSLTARDREANAARIRESLEDGTASVGGKRVHCGVCGSPFGNRTRKRNACDDCQQQTWKDWAAEKLSPEEIYPETTNDEEV